MEQFISAHLTVGKGPKYLMWTYYEDGLTQDDEQRNIKALEIVERM